MSAIAGYGDVSEDGYPSWAERDVHIWTNMMRVDPEEFFGPGNDWGASCDFSDFYASEREMMAPLYYDFNLNDAARFHSIDMWENDWFDHPSSDGTSFGARMGRFYTDSSWVGENIAMGYPDAMVAVVHGWMCSAGHRANIMNADYNELGTGVVSTYYTQDFANGDVFTASPIAMGNHNPMMPAGSVNFFVDYQGGEPDRIQVMVDGVPTDLDLEFGEADQGVYTATISMPVLPATAPNCHSYYFRWEAGDDRGSFPEEGSYLFGSTCPEENMWRSGHPSEDDDTAGMGDDVKGWGCSNSGHSRGGPLAVLGLIGFLAVTRRRS